MTAVYDGIAIELLLDDLFFVIHDGLNDKMDDMQTQVWNPRDTARYTRLGIPVVLHSVEHVEPENLIQGDIPPLIDANVPETSYPQICITPETIQPDPEDASADQFNIYQNILDVHSVVKANPAEGPNFTYFRAVRTCEALHSVVMGNPKMRRMLQGISNPQLVQPSPPFKFQPQEGHGEDWWWRSARIRYLIKSINRP